MSRNMNESRASSSDAAALGGTSTLRIALSWMLVSIPLLWGVYQTFLKSLALFQ